MTNPHDHRQLLLTLHEFSMVVDALAENALKEPPISTDVEVEKVLLVSCVCETPTYVEYLTSWFVLPWFEFS